MPSVLGQVEDDVESGGGYLPGPDEPGQVNLGMQ